MQPGDRVSFEKDGVLHTERVDSIHYDSGCPPIYRRLNRWQRFARRLTPPRWRTSLLIREGRPASVTINPPEWSRGNTLAQLEQMRSAVDKLMEG